MLVVGGRGDQEMLIVRLVNCWVEEIARNLGLMPFGQVLKANRIVDPIKHKSTFYKP